MKNELGRITLGFVIFVALFALALDAAFQVVPLYMNYLSFKSEIESRAMEPQQVSGENGDKIRTVLIKKAAEFNIPLDPEKLGIDFGDHTTHISASWTAEAKFLGGYFPKMLPFNIDVNKANFRS